MKMYDHYAENVVKKTQTTFDRNTKYANYSVNCTENGGTCWKEKKQWEQNTSKGLATVYNWNKTNATH